MKSESRPAPTADTETTKVFGFEHDVDGIAAQVLIPELTKLCKEQKWPEAFATCLVLAADPAARAECQAARAA